MHIHSFFHSLRFFHFIFNFRFHIDKRCQHRCSWKCLSIALILVAVVLTGMLAYFAGKLLHCILFNIDFQFISIQTEPYKKWLTVLDMLQLVGKIKTSKLINYRKLSPLLVNCSESFGGQCLCGRVDVLMEDIFHSTLESFP